MGCPFATIRCYLWLFGIIHTIRDYSLFGTIRCSLFATVHYLLFGFSRLPLKSVMIDQIKEMEELQIPLIVLSTKDDVLLKIGEAKYKLVFGTAEVLFLMFADGSEHQEKNLC